MRTPENRAKQRAAHLGRPKTHGHASNERLTGTYYSWRSMKTRVKAADLHTAKYYGDVSMAPRWEAFESFLADMGERPEGTTLDRIDPTGDYEPGNCRWATLQDQRANRRAP